MSYGHVYTDEEVNWLRRFTPLYRRDDLAIKFSQAFNLKPVTGNTISAVCRRRGIVSPYDGKFKKGLIPHNKGMKGYLAGRELKGRFKKGAKPKSWRPVGSERVDREGFHYVKVAEPKKWRLKHVLLWESKNGPVQKGNKVIFLDGNRDNIQEPNLMIVSDAEMARINQDRRLKLIKNPDMRRAYIMAIKIEFSTRLKAA